MKATNTHKIFAVLAALLAAAFAFAFAACGGDDDGKAQGSVFLADTTIKIINAGVTQAQFATATANVEAGYDSMTPSEKETLISKLHEIHILGQERWLYRKIKDTYMCAFPVTATIPNCADSFGGIVNGSWSPVVIPPQNAPELSVNTWEDAHVSVGYLGKVLFTFTATAVTQYIHVQFGTLTDMWLEVFDSNGKMIGSASNLGSGTQKTSRTLGVGSQYYVLVSSSSSPDGTYKIAFNASTEAPSE